MMPRAFWGWAGGCIAALVASAAAAQLVPKAPTLKPLTTTAGRITKPLVRGAPTVVTPAQPITTLGTLTQPLASTVRSSPLLKAPLGTATGPLKIVTSPVPEAPVQRESVRTFSMSLAGQLLAVEETAKLASDRASRLASLIRANQGELESDELWNPVVRGRVVLINPDALSLRRVTAAGFRIEGNFALPTLSLRIVTIAAPHGLSARAALRRVRALSPRLQADYDHIFQPAGGPLQPSPSPLPRGSRASRLVIGMVDGGVGTHPALQGQILAQRGFAGPVKASGHGTAVASLMAGQSGAFHGAATGASLLVADVYGGRPSGGSATAIAQALNWLASTPAKVVNVSLVGPADELVRRAVAGLRNRGIAVVAAVGNDGPAAPPQFPASYRGVIAITGVDSSGVALFESGNSTHLDFAAPGADMAAAIPGRGYTRVRGSSFAAPLAAGRLAVLGSMPRLASEARPGKGRVGRGIVCWQCRIAPQLVGAR